MSDSLLSAARASLRSVFGFDSFRPGQEEIIAAVLAVEMKSLLIGESADPDMEGAVRRAALAGPEVASIIHLRTMHLGPEEILVAAKTLGQDKVDAALKAAAGTGKRIGEVKDQTIAMGWDVERAGVYLSLGYVGLLDEFALFDRALTAEDVALLHDKPDLLTPLKRK